MIIFLSLNDTGILTHSYILIWKSKYFPSYYETLFKKNTAWNVQSILFEKTPISLKKANRKKLFMLSPLDPTALIVFVKG